MRALIAAVVLVALAACASPTAFDRGLADLRAGRYAQAQAHFDEALQASAASLANRGVARARLGDLDGAIEDYTRALELAPEDADILFNRGNAWVAKGEYQRAIADFIRAIEADPGHARALFRYAAIELGREPKATAVPRPRAGLEGAAPPLPVATPPAVAPPVAASPVPTAPPAPLAAAPPALPTPPLVAAPAPPAAAAPPPAPEKTEPAPAAPPATSAPSPPPTPPVALAPTPPPVVPALDSQALGSRALTRELQGDHAGALEDLRAAIAKETAPERLLGLRNLLLLLESSRDRRDPGVRGDPTR